MKTTQAIIGKEEMILAHYGLPDITQNRHIDCPICAKKKKFRLHRRGDSVNWICVCGSGGLFQLIELVVGLDFKTAANEIDKLIGNTQEPQAQQQKPKANQEQQTFNRFSNIKKNDNLKEYLLSRGIRLIPRYGVKYSSSEWDNDEKRSFGCMYSIATDESSKIAYTHKTYLEGSQKADIERQKKLFTVNENTGSCAIRMFDVADVLGVSEGIESGLSAAQIYKHPVWAVLNTSIMKKFRAPNGVKHLIVYADNDKNGAGLAAAFECAHRNILANNEVEKVTVKWPEEQEKDFNDMLNEPMQCYQWELFK